MLIRKRIVNINVNKEQRIDAYEENVKRFFETNKKIKEELK